MLDADVRIKPRICRRPASFKIRGAYNRIVTLSDEEKSRGVVAASAGNHGQALAYAATRAGVTATIVMPATAAIAKIDATRSYGQSVILEGAIIKLRAPRRSGSAPSAARSSSTLTTIRTSSRGRAQSGWRSQTKFTPDL